MASAPDFTDTLVLDEETVHTAIRAVLQRITASHGNQNVSLQSSPEVETIVSKIHDMLLKLEEILIKLRDFLNVPMMPSFLEKYLLSSQINPNEILNEIDNIRTTLESFLPKLSYLQTASDSTFALLVQMSIEGIEIPSFEDFISTQTEFSPVNILLSSMANSQETNTPNQILMHELVMLLVQNIAKHSAWCRKFESPLISVGCFVLQLHSALFEEWKKFMEERKEAHNQIAALKQNLDESQIRPRLSRIERYISQATEISQSSEMKLANKIWESYLSVKQSILSCRMQNTNANDIDIIKELMGLPHCSGLVHPIVSLLGCSVENGWRIILDIFSQIHSNH